MPIFLQVTPKARSTRLHGEKTMTDRYNKELIFKFMNDALNGRELNQVSAYAAAVALMDYLAGVDVKKALGLSRKKGKRKKKLDTSHVYIDDPLFGIVQQLVYEKITPAEAKTEFAKILKRRGIKIRSQRTIERYIRDIRPRAETTNKTLHWLESIAEKKKT